MTRKELIEKAVKLNHELADDNHLEDYANGYVAGFLAGKSASAKIVNKRGVKNAITNTTKNWITNIWNDIKELGEE